MTVNDSTRGDAGDIHQVLGLRGGSRTWRRRGAWLLALVVVSGAALVFSRTRATGSDLRYTTEQARRGDLTVTVTATGSLASQTQVDVGTEISGIIEHVYVDYSSPVKARQPLAAVNTDKLDAQRAQQEAALKGSEARLRQSAATTLEAKSQLARLQRVREQSGGRVPSTSEMEAQEATVTRAQADEAAAGAEVAQAKANLAAIDSDLRKAIVRSPIDGIVLVRDVDPGQTVAASFQTPVLFTIAKDLSQMKLSVDVDEADIGKVAVGQTATFHVDAYGQRRFDSRVTAVRSTAKTSNGVVTYETILTVDNRERLLRPGMTATADIVVQQMKQALLVPNSALRFTPPATGTGSVSLLPAPPGGMARPADTESGEQAVWVLESGTPTRVPVIVGTTDGTSTEITGGNLTVSQAVIVDAVSAKS